MYYAWCSIKTTPLNPPPKRVVMYTSCKHALAIQTAISNKIVERVNPKKKTKTNWNIWKCNKFLCLEKSWCVRCFNHQLPHALHKKDCVITFHSFENFLHQYRTNIKGRIVLFVLCIITILRPDKRKEWDRLWASSECWKSSFTIRTD